MDQTFNQGQIHQSTDLEAIQVELFATSGETLLFYDPSDLSDDPRPNGFVELVYGNEGYNVIADYSGFCCLCTNELAKRAENGLIGFIKLV